MIYLDNNATTRVLPEILETILPFYQTLWGNPSSMHTFGAQLTTHMNRAREEVAELIGAQKSIEIVFTSGGTESNNLAIRGGLQAHPEKRHMITTAVEHSSVMMLAQQLQKENYSVTYLPVDSHGALKLADLEAAIRPNTGLVSIMWANNETGVLFPIEKIANLCEAKNIPLHVDAVQATGKIFIDVAHIPISLLSLSGHKIHALKGTGTLYIRRGTQVKPLLYGGHQERGRRAGTENVAGIVGLGKACALAKKRLESDVIKQVKTLRDDFEQKLFSLFSWIHVNGRESPRLPNTSNISFTGLDGEAIALLLGEADIAVSTGSACMSGSLEPSHVLKAMGADTKYAKGAIRFSFSGETTQKELDQAIEAVKKIVGRLKR